MERTEKIMRGSLLSVNNSRTKERARNGGRILYQFSWFTAEKFATAIRNYWHQKVIMSEDDRKIRRGNEAELFLGIRRIDPTHVIWTQA